MEEEQRPLILILIIELKLRINDQCILLCICLLKTIYIYMVYKNKIYQRHETHKMFYIIQRSS